MKFAALSLAAVGIAAYSISHAQSNKIDQGTTASVQTASNIWHVEQNGKLAGCQLVVTGPNSVSVQTTENGQAQCTELLANAHKLTLDVDDARGEIRLVVQATGSSMVFAEAEHGGYDMISPAYPLLTITKR